MPPSEMPTNPTRPPERDSHSTAAAVQEPELESGADSTAPEPTRQSGIRSSSRYIDYDTHELLERITQYEDERRWQRIREGIWISLLAHILFFSALTWIPRYVFHVPEVIDPIDAIKQRKDLTYLDELPDALKQIQLAKPKPPVLKPNETVVDQKTLDQLKALEKARPKPTPPAPPVPAPQQAEATPPPAPMSPQVQQPVAPPSTAPPVPQPQLQLETPRPAPVPARPNFSMASPNPADQLRQAMRDSQQNQGDLVPDMRGGPRSKDPNGADGARILSDTQGVDFSAYLQKLKMETYRTWDPLIPDEVNPPINKRGQVAIVFTILPNGRLQPHSMTLVGRSGDVGLDRAAWGAIEGADYPPLPREFHGPNIQIEVLFSY